MTTSQPTVLTTQSAVFLRKEYFEKIFRFFPQI